jgi:hypothetical protein
MGELIESLIVNGFAPVPIEPESKAPRVNGWPKRRFDAKAWSNGQGIGI